MAGRDSRQEDIIRVLSRLVQAGALVAFEVDLSGSLHESASPSVSVIVGAPNDLVPALQQVRDALEPLEVDATIHLSVWNPEGSLDL